MSNWLRQATYLGSVICGIAAAFVPSISVPLIGVSTFLAGYATTHPDDKVAPVLTVGPAPKGLT